MNRVLFLLLWGWGVLAQEPPIVLCAARLFDAKSDGVMSPGVVVVRGKRIKGVGEAAIPSDAKVPSYFGGGAAELGAGLPSTVCGSISSVRVPSGSYRLS
jgi:hypothetical protein